MAAVSDDFNRANNASLGASWTDYAVGSALRIVSNTCQQTTAGTNGASRFNTAISTAHFAQADCTIAGAGDSQASVLARCDAAAISFYIGGIDRTAGALTILISKVVAGTPTVLVQTAAAFTTGNVILTATGTSSTMLTLYVNGAQVARVTDSSSPLSTQTRVGVLAGGAIATVDNFVGSDLPLLPPRLLVNQAVRRAAVR